MRLGVNGLSSFLFATHRPCNSHIIVFVVQIPKSKIHIFFLFIFQRNAIHKLWHACRGQQPWFCEPIDFGQTEILVWCTGEIRCAARIAHIQIFQGLRSVHSPQNSLDSTISASSKWHRVLQSKMKKMCMYIYITYLSVYFTKPIGVFCQTCTIECNFAIGSM